MIPCFYLFIYRKLREASEGNKMMPHFQTMEIIAETTRQIPKRFHYAILKEMEDYRLIRRIDKQKIQLIGGLADAKLERYSQSLLLA